MKFDLDHIGIAVETLEGARGFYEALGLGPMTTEVVESERVKVGFFELANGSRIELLEPTTSESPIAKFLANKGAGIHHICLKVNDIKAAMEKLKAQGFKLINEEPKRGAHNCWVAFVHPKSTGGVLLELSQSAGEASQ